MAITPFEAFRMDEKQPEVIVLHNVLTTTAHDLGGLASALLLRADVLEHGASEPSVRAMRSIAAELRVLGQQLRAIRGEDDHGTLAPAPHAATQQWSARVARFGVGLLPRGSAVACNVDDARIPHELAHSLWCITLAVLGAIGEASPGTRATVHIRSEDWSPGLMLTIGATAHGEPLTFSLASRDTWWSWALQHAAQHHLSLSADNQCVTITYVTPSA